MFAPSRSLLQYLRQATKSYNNAVTRSNGTKWACFSTTANARSGHSKWATIKHDKARADAKKNKQRSILAQQIELTSKLYGPDPDANPRLKTIIADAKRQGLPKDVLESAIKRGQGLSTTGKPLENVTVEAMFPGGIAAIIECATESKAKTLMEVRTILTKNGGKEGVVAFLFEKKGIVRVKLPDDETVSADEIMEATMDIEGFEDLEESGDDRGLVLVSEPSAVKAIADAVGSLKGAEVEEMVILWQPIESLEVSKDSIDIVDACVEKLEDLTEVQNIHLNIQR